MSGKEMKYIDAAFERNLVFPMGPNVAGLEEDLKRFTGIAACSCLSSGTAAIHLALINLGIGAGDEVICSSFTFSASANPIVYQHAVPVFVDSEPGTWNMDPALLKKQFGDRLAFWGAIDTRDVLPFGSPAEVRAEVRRIIDILGEGGGYVLGSVQTIQAEVPPENIVAMFEEAASYRPGR